MVYRLAEILFYQRVVNNKIRDKSLVNHAVYKRLVENAKLFQRYSKIYQANSVHTAKITLTNWTREHIERLRNLL